MKKEKAFVIIIGQSFFIMPYHIHKETPDIKTINMPAEALVACFSLIILKSWGNNEADVKIPAIMPIAVLGITSNMH